MDISYEQRQELNALSKEVFGAKSRWRTLLRVGHVVVLSEDFKRKLVYKKGAKGRAGKPQGFIRKSKQHYFTVESVTRFMVEEKTRLAELKAKAEAKVNEANSKA